jgi:protein gp37
MSSVSKIEWTEATWNPVTGCRKISPACNNCYAETFANRFRGVKGHPYEHGFLVKLWYERLHLPLTWRKPRFVFVNSMSDLFLSDVPDTFIESTFQTMSSAHWHTYQILTKRAERMFEWTTHNYTRQTWPRNVWLGVSIETSAFLDRADFLSSTPAHTKFISFEPLLDRIQFTNGVLKVIDWVIVGGESGQKARRMHPEWVGPIYEECKKLSVPFFFKQWGTFDSRGRRVGKRKAGRKYLGRQWSGMPQHSTPP